MKGGKGVPLGCVGIPLTLLQVTWGLLERALLGSGRLLALCKANSQLAYHRHRPTRGKDEPGA